MRAPIQIEASLQLRWPILEHSLKPVAIRTARLQLGWHGMTALLFAYPSTHQLVLPATALGEIVQVTVGRGISV